MPINGYLERGAGGKVLFTGFLIWLSFLILPKKQNKTQNQSCKKSIMLPTQEEKDIE